MRLPSGFKFTFIVLILLPSVVVISHYGKGLVSGTDYYIRVTSGGIISYKGGGQDDEAKFTMQ